MLDKSIKKFLLAVYCPRYDDGTSLVRAMGPLRAMQREDDRLELRRPQLGPEGQELTWDWLMGCDALFVQRPWTSTHAQLLVQAKMLGVPVWVDWDDDYLSIEKQHPAYNVFMYAGAHEMMDRLQKLADVITVTTAELARVKREALPGAEMKVRIVPNACHWRFTNAPRTKRVSWRGGISHMLDLEGVLPDLAEIAHAEKEWFWVFLGDTPYNVDEMMPKETLISGFGGHPWLYMEALSNMAPWVHYVAMRDRPFKRCVSNLSWIEATAAGAICLAPNWEEWQAPGIVNYSNGDFGARLKDLMGQMKFESEAHRAVATSREYIRENLLPRKVNAARWDILNELYAQRTEGRVTPVDMTLQDPTATTTMLHDNAVAVTGS